MRIFLFLISIIIIQSSCFAQDTIILQSDYLVENDTILVFTPKTNSDIDSFPLVYMLHGYGGNYSQWSNITDLQNYADKYNFIIACPDGLYDSWYFNSPKEKKSEWESFFISDLHPSILKIYNIQKRNVFITGLSMGGHGSLYLFIRNTELFNAAASSSGTLDLNQSSLKYSSLSDKLGEYDKSKDIFDNYSCIYLIDKLRFSNHPIFFDCGYNDHLYKSNLEFWEKAKSLKVNAVFKQSRGRHNHAYWEKSILWHFIFFKENLITN